MGWINRILGKDSSSSASRSRSSSAKYLDRAAARRIAKHEQAAAEAKQGETYPFRAVVIRTGENCCAAAERNTGQKFLAAHAPQLPLGTCDQPQQCRCRYKHLTDRRQETRRDVDDGLPGQPYHGENRRYRRERRRQQLRVSA